MAEKLTPFDEAEHLNTPSDVAAYLNAVLAEDDSTLLTHALGVIARARGMTEIARVSDLTRASLYKALSEQGRPEFETVRKVLGALGLRLQVAAA